MNINEMVALLQNEVSIAIHEDPDQIDKDMNFLKMGISSIQALKLISKIKKQFEIDINPIALLEYKTIFEFSAYLVECIEAARDCVTEAE